jgi:ribosome-binding ATPase
MPIKIGLVGLPNVGKSSLFNFLTKKEIKDIANYPFATIDPNIGIMALTDPRLEKLSKYYQSQKTAPSVIEIVDIAGLVKGASEGLGLGNEFLSHIREVDLICHVLRCFPEKEIIHVEKTIDPIRDYEIIQLELILADLQQIKKRLEKFKIRDENSQKERPLLQLIRENLEKEIPVSQINLKEEEKKIIKSYNFLTSKPFFLLVNFSGDQTEIKDLEKYAKKKKLSFLPLAIKLEKETENLSAAEKEELGWISIDFSLLTNKIKELLKLKTFFTVGKDETKSWLAKSEMKARECAGLIHSDIEKNFIRAEVYNYTDWLQTPEKEELKKAGKIRSEGVNYNIKEGDICYFLFGKNK